ncbi:MAG: hypothetical protein ACI9TF_001006 [Paracrocinitomix sp.]|jgi:hypothetical protein
MMAEQRLGIARRRALVMSGASVAMALIAAGCTSSAESSANPAIPTAPVEVATPTAETFPTALPILVTAKAEAHQSRRTPQPRR